MTRYVLPVVTRVKCAGWPTVWLPVILLWPLIIAIFLLALPLCLFVPVQRRQAIEIIGVTYLMLCALRGTSVEVSDRPGRRWNFSLY